MKFYFERGWKSGWQEADYDDNIEPEEEPEWTLN